MNKRILLILATMMIVASGFAKNKSGDDENSGSKFGVEAGYNHKWLYPNTSVLISYMGKTGEASDKCTFNLDGFYIGPSYTYFLNSVDGLFVNGSILYQYGRCGDISKDKLSALTFDLLWGLDYTEEPQQLKEFHNCDKYTYTAHSLEIPIRIGYNFDIKDGIGVQVFAGPVFDFALDWKVTGTKGDVTYDLNQLNGNLYIKSGNNSATYSDNARDRAVYNSFDVALGCGVGFTYNWFYFNLSCDWGLTNICKVASSAGKIDDKGMFSYVNKASQTNLKLGVGVRF